MKHNSPPSSTREVVRLTAVPPDACRVGDQPMRCDACGECYALPLYEMPDGPVISIARCPACGSRENQMPAEVAA